MPRHSKPWTQEADCAVGHATIDILTQAVVEGRSLPIICKRLDRTEAAVRARAYVLRLSFSLVSVKRGTVRSHS